MTYPLTTFRYSISLIKESGWVMHITLQIAWILISILFKDLDTSFEFYMEMYNERKMILVFIKTVLLLIRLLACLHILFPPFYLSLQLSLPIIGDFHLLSLNFSPTILIHIIAHSSDSSLSLSTILALRID